MKIDPLRGAGGLDFPKMIHLYRTFKGRIKVSFGIGTNLTNDVGNMPLDIVIKMVAAGGRPVAKISDECGKSMCEDEEYLHYLATVYGIDVDKLPSAEKQAPIRRLKKHPRCRNGHTTPLPGRGISPWFAGHRGGFCKNSQLDPCKKHRLQV